MALSGLITLTAAAIVPAAVALKVNSPLAKHPADGVTGQKSPPASPFTYLGSKAHAAPGAVEGPPKLVVGPPPRGVNSRVAAVAVVPRFCTTIVDIVPARP